MSLPARLVCLKPWLTLCRCTGLVCAYPRCCSEACGQCLPTLHCTAAESALHHTWARSLLLQLGNALQPTELPCLISLAPDCRCIAAGGGTLQQASPASDYHVQVNHVVVAC